MKHKQSGNTLVGIIIGIIAVFFFLAAMNGNSGQAGDSGNKARSSHASAHCEQTCDDCKDLSYESAENPFEHALPPGWLCVLGRGRTKVPRLDTGWEEWVAPAPTHRHRSEPSDFVNDT